MLLLNEVIEFSFTSKGSVCLFIASVGKACLENSANMRSRLRLQTPGGEERRGLSVPAHTPHQPDTTRDHAHSILGITLTRANCLAGGRRQTSWSQIGLSPVLFSFRVKPQACRRSSLSPFPHCLRDNNFHCLDSGACLMALSKYVEVMEEWKDGNC